MGGSPSKELERKPKAADATASVTDEENSIAAPEASTKKSKRKSPMRKNGSRSNMNGEDGLPQGTAPSTVSTHISDDQVNVNLAMADLMAYLQVVATNSQNLPTTRRDNPELRKTEHNLTADEYARKSAAFIPADVRVIAGSFTKYGRVWDLPTSEEYTACDGAQEPGRSYGGACCNAMLKVLYDAANEAADAAQEAAATDAIFDDDDEESLANNTVEMNRTRTFESLVLGVVPTTITWATLLRKMKAEIQEIEYAQAPLVTSTRKFDLNQPFSLVPEDFDPKNNTMRSLLIGCNYTDVAGAELKASHDDVRSMKDYIVNVHGFPESKGLMTVLLDDDKHKHPTHMNIVESLKAIAEQSQPGDVVFIQFTGHGGRMLDSVDSVEAETYDEAFAPSDYTTSGFIRDTLIYKVLLAPMRYGVTVTVLMDTCDTGMVLDLPYQWSTKTDRRDAEPKMTTNNDFSFIRFLKVVKTLYEASSFTQLGKTVRTALRKPGDPTIEEEDEMMIEADVPTKPEAVEEQEAVPKQPAEQSAILKALAACTSPKSMPDCSAIDQPSPKKSNGDKKILDKTPGDAQNSQSFLEQVMNCAMLNIDDGEYSDEDTYHGRSAGDDDTYGTDTLGETTTYEYDSMTEDDGYESNRHQRRVSRARRNR